MARHGLKDKDINLLNVCEKKKEARKYTAAMKYAILPVSMGVVLLGVFLGFTIYNHSLDTKISDTQDEIKKVQDQLANDPNLERYNSLLSAKKDLEKYTRIYKNMQSYPELSQNTFDKILVASGSDVNVTTFSYVRESQIITLQIEATSANSSEEFVRRLKNLSIFSAVDYSGYARQEKEIITQDTTTPQTDTKDTTTTSPTTSDALQQLLNGLNAAQTTTNKKETTETASVYSATILCKLK